MKRVLGAASVRDLDGKAESSGVPSLLLMESAGRGAAEAIRTWAPDLAGGRILAVCGTGGNGGDALAAARWLGQWGADPRAILLGEPRGPAADQAAAFRASFPKNVVPVEGEDDVAALEAWLAEADLVLDGILGVGLSGPPRGRARTAIEAVEGSRLPVVAIDLPSGLDADTGRVDGPTVRAALTLAMGCLKPCHLLPPAAERCGEVRVVDVAYPVGAWDEVDPVALVLEAGDVRALLPSRPRFGHKGTFGRVLVVGGAVGMAGAAALAAHGALRAGAGLVHVLCPEPVYPIVASLVPEALVHPGAAEDGQFAPEAAEEAVRWTEGMDVVVVGPGLGRGPGPAAIVQALVQAGIRLVLDADALFALAREPELLAASHGELVLTPHPGEFGRLVGTDPEEIVPDKIRWAREKAEAWRAVVVLKGPPTAIADPSGHVLLSTTGNTALAHGGSGDVLAGMVAGLWAGGAGAGDAASAAAFVHGRAAELLAATSSPRALLPTDLLAALPEAFAVVEG
ncbi:MAG: NAD(P)H-hydrate epimerase [Candidatus Bipolaricaulis sibiricus]|uniref:Bifunctional NAD(P)H-hydrate repair enzyme n=1 Tax=Bipolaricaulis sibiricus TaxID=2501609 RepID=A0A410FUF0_BIPS1|nr:MAG: NAD(P)H-hydrate epimerase [Candidatus Bipolaricaulis sibiricus]